MTRLHVCLVAVVLCGSCMVGEPPKASSYSARELIDIAVADIGPDANIDDIYYRDLPEGWAWIDGLVGTVTEDRMELFPCDSDGLSEWSPGIVVHLRRSKTNIEMVRQLRSVDAEINKWVRLYGRIDNRKDPGGMRRVFGAGDHRLYIGPVLNGTLRDISLRGCPSGER